MNRKNSQLKIHSCFCPLKSNPTKSHLIKNYIIPAASALLYHTVSLYKQVAGEQRYHPECFSCMQCKRLIGDGDTYMLIERSELYW